MKPFYENGALCKPCTVCGSVLSLEEGFHKNARTADGRAFACKPCARRLAIERRNRRLEHWREYDRMRGRTVERKIQAREALRRRRAKYPQRDSARAAVGRALRDGRLTRGTCEVCGSSKTEGHHDDYGKPLEVRWLCNEHHREHHMSRRREGRSGSQ